MRPGEIDRELREADPASERRMAWLELGPAEAALGEEIVTASTDDERSPGGARAATSATQSTGGSELLHGVAMPWPGPGRRRRRLFGLAGLAAVAAAVVVLPLVGGGASESPSKAYGADLVRFAEASPLLLLEAPGWRVQNANDERRREGVEGSIEFVTGKPIPYESITYLGDPQRPREKGMFPPRTRQRRVELFWHQGSLAQWVGMARGSLHPHGQRWVELPVLDTTAKVDTRAEFFVNQGGPGNRQMVAFWKEGDYVLELRAAVPDQAAFEERLAWLKKVDLDAWLEAMPPKVVKAGDHDAAVREMLRGIPVPKTFSPSRVPDEGLTTARYQVGANVTGTVSCLWLRQWGAARRSGDVAAEREADRAMATAKDWKILRQMVKDGAYPQVIWELAPAMRRGYWEWNHRRRRLLPHAEGLGCARLGLPLLPRKMKLQRERGPPAPPR